MVPKPTIQQYFSILLITSLVACGKQADHVTPTIGSAAADRTADAEAFQTAAVQTVKAMPTFGPAVTNTQALFPPPTVSFFTFTPGPSPTSAPTKTPSSATPAPTRTPLPFVPLEGLRVADDAGGNVYVQDSGKDAIRLTNTGQDSDPLLSDDGQKIAFYRERNQLCVIGVDGTGERVLVSRAMLSTLGYKNEFIELYDMTFLSGTHQLIFNTRIYDRKNGEGHGQRNDDLWFVDADTGTLRQLRVPGQGGNFLIAPNGRWIAVETIDHIDVIDTQGQMIRRNLVTNPPMDDYYGITWASMSWMPNSSELIVLSTSIPPGTGIPVIRDVWRYPLDGRRAVEIELSPLLVGDAFSVSPDGNWIVYGSESGNTAEPGVYLGNLRDGTSQLIYTAPINGAGYRDVPLNYDSWSPDSVHFIFSDRDYRMFLGNIHGETIPLGRGTGIVGWIDNRHYLFDGGEVIGEVGTQGRVNVMGVFPYAEVAGYDPVSFVFLGR